MNRPSLSVTRTSISISWVAARKVGFCPCCAATRPSGREVTAVAVTKAAQVALATLHMAARPLYMKQCALSQALLYCFFEHFARLCSANLRCDQNASVGLSHPASTETRNSRCKIQNANRIRAVFASCILTFALREAEIGRASCRERV